MASKTYATPEKKPTGTVAGLSVKKTNSTWTMTAKWKVPSTLTSDKDAAGEVRTESLTRTWTLNTFTVGKKAKKGKVNSTITGLPVTATESGISVSSFECPQVHRTYHRATDFFPAKNKPMVSGITFTVRCANRKGSSDKANSRTWALAKPDKPKVGAIKQNEDTGDVSCTITAADWSKTNRERYDTRWQMRVYDSRYPTTKTNPKVTEGTFTGKKTTISTDIPQRMRLGYGDFVRIDVRAMSRGLAGMSDGLAVGKSSESKAWTAWRHLYIGYPNQPDVDKVTYSSKAATGKVTVVVKTDATTAHPVTGIRLEVLRNSEAKTATAAAADENWQSTDIVDDGQCTALATSVQDVISEQGLRSWVRVKTWNQFEDLFYRYSAPWQLTKIYQPAPSGSDDECKILSATSGTDGTSAVIVIGYDAKDKSKRDDATGTELSWAGSADAWQSTEPPKTFNVTWNAETKSGDPYYSKWYYTQTVTIRGLTEGERTYVRARRYLEGDDRTTYGETSNRASVVPQTVPASATLSAPEFVERGHGVPLTWTFEGGGTQTEWQVLTGKAKKVTASDGTVSWRLYDNSSNPAVVVARGTDPLGATTVPAKWMRGKTCTKYTRSDGTVPLAVRVTAGGGSVTSDAALVGQAERPVLQVFAPSVVTAQPATIALACSTDASVVLVVRAGTGGCAASGVGEGRDQAAGDVVWQALVDPEWGGEAVTTANLATNDPDNWTYESEGSSVIVVRNDRLAACTPGQAYTCSVSGTDTQDGRTWVAGMTFYDEDLVPLDASTGPTVTAPTGAAWVSPRISVDGDAPDTDSVGDGILVMLEQGSTATAWVASGADALANTATVDTPTDPEPLDLRDGAPYVVTARATDRRTGLVSDEATVEFAVLWAHQAPVPPDSIEVVPSDVTDEAGVRTRSCAIRLAADMEHDATTDPSGMVTVGDFASLNSATAYGASTQGGTPAPDAPVPIASVTDLSLVLTGRNLLDTERWVYVEEDTKTVNGVTITREEDGWFRVSGVRDKAGQFSITMWGSGLYEPKMQWMGLHPGDDIYVTVETEGTPFIGGSAFNNSSHIAIYGPGSGISERFGGFNPLAGHRKLASGMTYVSRIVYYWGANIPQGTEVDGRFRMTLVRGTEAPTAYLPYEGGELPIDLDGHELRSLPDGTRDELTVDAEGHAVLVQRVGFKELVSSDVWQVRNSGTASWYYEVRYASDTNGVQTTDLLSNRYVGAAITNTGTDKGIWLVVSGAGLYFRIREDAEKSLADFKTWLDSNPVTVIYPLATPVTHDLGTVTLPTLPSPDLTAWPATDVTAELSLGYRTVGARSTDVYDVYRVTPDGATRVTPNEGVALDATVTDRLAPYGGTEVAYRVACRTADGDVDWLDYAYDLPGSDLRIDFGGEYVELPYNLVPQDSYGKDFEARAKLSGDVDGYWNEAVTRKGSFSTDLIRITEQAKAAALRRLARHAGPCFVRTPDGCAYPADVQVTQMSARYSGAALAVSLDATEVSMTDEFRAEVSS